MPDTPESFLPLSPKDFHILFALAARPLHGYALVSDVEERTGGRVVLEPANLYRRIHQFVQQGLLEETAPPESEADVDSRRRYYETTRLGLEVLRAEVAMMRCVLSEAAALGLAPDRRATE